MRLEIRGLNLVVNGDLRQHTERRIAFALGRFSDQIHRVTVRLSDVNGPRGGHDKQCRIEVAGDSGWQVTLAETSSDLHAAVSSAAERAARCVRRAMEKDRAFEPESERTSEEAKQ